MVLSMERWVGKVAIVTGASVGIGAAIAERLVEEGMKVLAVARRKEILDALAQKLVGKKGQLYPLKVDMMKEEDILRAFQFSKKNLGPVHVLINNAAILVPGGLTEGKAEDWEQLFKVNVIGLSIATREAVRDMKENGVDGHIIHINSIAGHIPYNIKGIEMYSASKHAITALTETLRCELRNQKSKIKISSISPGSVATDMVKSLVDGNAQTSTFGEEPERPPMIQPEDVADSVIYALSTPPHVQVHDVMIRPQGEAF